MTNKRRQYSRYRECSGPGRPSREEARASELQQSVARFEEAVQELVRGARVDLTDRAAGVIDETTRRIQDAVDGKRMSDYGTRRRVGDAPAKTAKLYRDVSNERIRGVCSGFAKYFGVEPWVARCVAVTGLLFLPAITFPAYWIAYFVMDEEPTEPEKRQRRERAKQSTHQSGNKSPRRTPEYSARRALRHIGADMTAAELRLRRMEGHVTSDNYELQRQLNAMEAT